MARVFNKFMDVVAHQGSQARKAETAKTAVGTPLIVGVTAVACLVGNIPEFLHLGNVVNDLADPPIIIGGSFAGVGLCNAIANRVERKRQRRISQTGTAIQNVHATQDQPPEVGQNE